MIYVVNLNISERELKKLYQGIASQVSAHSVCGKSIRFPAQSLRQFVTDDGVIGRFRLDVTEDNRLITIERI